MESKDEILALKCKVMLQKIEKLHNIYIKILPKSYSKEINSLEIIKNQYLRMYDELIERGEYNKYKEIEDIVIKEISKIELKLDEYIYNTIQNYQEIIMNNMQRIRQSENYENFQNMGEELDSVKTLKELLKLYSPYISKGEEEKIQDEISQLKFDRLFRKQVEELIYEDGGRSSNLTQYSNETEKEIFKKLLEKKINSIRIDVFKDEQMKNDEIFEASTEQILSDSTLLERLIIIDMKRNPYNYINLLKAKVFNAHLCNIGNNPFEKEVYLTKEQLKELGYDNYRYERSEGLKTNKVNYSLLKAILRSVITDENISIIECENLYEKFGFECRPILVNIGQQCIKMIFDDVKGSKKFLKISQDLKKNKEGQEGQEGNYCKMDFETLIYEFDNEEKDSDDLFNQILYKRRRKVRLTPQISKKRFFSKKQEMPEPKETLQEEKEKVKKEGILTTDIDIIISLIKDIIDKYTTRIQELKQRIEEKLQRIEEEGEFWNRLDNFNVFCAKYDIKRYEQGIEKAKNKIEWLEDLKNRNEKLTLEETRELLLTINDIYKELKIRYNPRKILSLENMKRGNQEGLSPMPYRYRWINGEHTGWYRSISCYSEPLWKKYQGEFKDLGIDVKKCANYYSYDKEEPEFEICVNLKDISDLPINYEKITLVTKEELQEIIKREEGNER